MAVADNQHKPVEKDLKSILVQDFIWHWCIVEIMDFWSRIQDFYIAVDNAYISVYFFYHLSLEYALIIKV